jgi:hypothetical protein
MSSRQEEKERRRKEREEQEAAAAKSASRKRRLQLVGGVVVAVLAVGGITAALVAGGGGSSGGSGDATQDIEPTVELAPARIADLEQAARAAGCDLKEQLPNEGAEHLPSNDGTFDDYKTNPPTSGTHTPIWAEDGVYEPGNEPAKELTVHALEHGRINFQYAVGTSPDDIAKMEALWAEDFNGGNGYHQLLFRNQTDMPFKFAATAWTNSIGCEELSDEAIDAFRAFRTKYVDKGPEIVP